MDLFDTWYVFDSIVEKISIQCINCRRFTHHFEICEKTEQWGKIWCNLEDYFSRRSVNVTRPDFYINFTWSRARSPAASFDLGNLPQERSVLHDPATVIMTKPFPNLNIPKLERCQWISILEFTKKKLSNYFVVAKFVAIVSYSLVIESCKKIGVSELIVFDRGRLTI